MNGDTAIEIIGYLQGIMKENKIHDAEYNKICNLVRRLHERSQ